MRSTRLWGILCGIAILIVTAILVLQDAHVRGCFIDELNSVQSAFHFFKYQHYTFFLNRPYMGAFTPEMSIGIASTWPAGLAWGFFGNIEFARWLNAVYCWLLGFVFFNVIYKKEYEIAFFMNSLFFFLVLNVVPYSIESLNHNLGEISGFFLLLLGAAVIRRNMIAGSLILGLSVWHAKFIYLPFALVVMVYGISGNFRRSMKCLFYFTVPLWAWMILVGLKTGVPGLMEWISGRLGFIYRGNSGLDQKIHFASLFDRFTSSQFEWSRYSGMVKMKFAVLVLAALASLVYGLYQTRKTKFINPSAQMTLLSALLMFVFFFSWYFFVSPGMWLRHALPGLLVSLTICTGAIGWVLKERVSSVTLSRCMVLVALMGVGFGVFKVQKMAGFHILNRERARMFLERCREDRAWGKGPMDLRECSLEANPPDSIYANCRSD